MVDPGTSRATVRDVAMLYLHTTDHFGAEVLIPALGRLPCATSAPASWVHPEAERRKEPPSFACRDRFAMHWYFRGA